MKTIKGRMSMTGNSGVRFRWCGDSTDDGVEAILHNARAMPPSLVSSCGVETEGEKRTQNV
jgi:hypothetical protein